MCLRKKKQTSRQQVHVWSEEVTKTKQTTAHKKDNSALIHPECKQRQKEAISLRY